MDKKFFLDWYNLFYAQLHDRWKYCESVLKNPFYHEHKYLSDSKYASRTLWQSSDRFIKVIISDDEKWVHEYDVKIA